MTTVLLLSAHLVLASPVQETPPATEGIRQTANTVTLAPGQPRPPATLADMKWLTGHWRGPALGGMSEEIWTAPEAGSMMGMYRLMKDGAVVFYELLTVVEEEGSLAIRLKHFNRDLTGWEEQNEVRSFKLVSRTPTRTAFEGMTFVHERPDTLTIFLAITNRKTGQVREERFEYTRVTPQ
ncbi:MAG TPA: DUF6265 family protein [Vicinamibacterales bacterium]